MNRKEQKSEMGSRYLTRSLSDFNVRRDGDSNPKIEGYFAVFNSNYELWPGASESVAPGAFDETLAGDIRALIDHETRLVLGRTKSGTLQLRQDERGLWGSIDVNPNDVDAMNLVARMERGDVDQCSFGFDILDEETEFREDGSIHWTIKSVKLYEVTVCTFPAYEETSVAVRKACVEEIQKRKNDEWKQRMIQRLKKGEQKNAEDIDAQKED